jgi:hypothetical protein
MDNAKAQLVDKLKTANNILVTVSRDPSVDQLASCLGLALMLNKLDKHSTGVFSGQIPSTLEFLQPEETLEKNTDSLRDFIIALDKAKADKLRYKVEDDVVRIFITPYKTSLSEADLEFSQGDFNVDLVIALGVRQQEDLDEAIVAHGRILHDATVASLNISPDGGLGTINWHDTAVSSLSEMVAELAQALNPELLDAQISTALLTGIVAETDRFSNTKTSPQTMSISAVLMAAGANQQLIASKLEEAETAAQIEVEDETGTDENNPDDESNNPPPDGTVEIDHKDDQPDESPAPDDDQPPAGPGTDDTTTDFQLPSPQADDLPAAPDIPPADDSPDALRSLSSGQQLITEPPTMGGTLTANSTSEPLDAAIDPLSMPTVEPPQILDRKPSEPTLSALEESVQADPATLPNEVVEDARDEVDHALAGGAIANDQDFPEPIQALNAQPMGDDLHPSQTIGPAQGTPPAPSLEEQIPGLSTTLSDNPTDQQPPVESADTTPPQAQVNDPTAPPPVPPPIPFQFGSSPNPPQDQK